jgi:hypothetical protein
MRAPGAAIRARKATMTPTGTDLAKQEARRLRSGLAAAGVDIPHGLALELVAQLHGARDWNTFTARADQPDARPSAGPGIPVLRMFSAQLTLPFYVDYLGFTVDWEHRFAPGLPLYAQVSRSQLVLHLSEHHGDGSPHTAVWAPVADVYRLRDELHAHRDARQRPGVDPDIPGGPTMVVIDPSGNVLRFCQAE